MPGRTPVDVAKVRELLAKGCTPKQICLRLGCQKSVVSMIANQKYRGPKQ